MHCNNLSIFCLMICFILVFFTSGCMIDNVLVQQPCGTNYHIIHIFDRGDNWEVHYQELFGFNACLCVVIPKIKDWERIAHDEIKEQISYLLISPNYHKEKIE